MPPSQFCPLVSDPATHSQLHPLSAPPTFSAMSWSSQPVLIWLLWKCSVSSSVTRNSTVVRKSPRIESSFNASTMFLGRGRGKAEKRATIILQASRAKGERGEGRGERGEERGERGEERGERGEGRGERGEERGERGEGRGERGRELAHTVLQSPGSLPSQRYVQTVSLQTRAVPRWLPR